MDDLAIFLKRETEVLAWEYERIQSRVLEDPGTAGDQGEENWATILKQWLPRYYHIVTKGRILGDKGVAGPQVDVLVLSPAYPQTLLDKKLYLAGGVVAAFECKVTLRSSHLRKFFENTVRVRDLSPKETGTLAREVRPSIIYGLLAHSHEWVAPSSTPADNLKNLIRDLDREFIKAPSAMPDLLCVANLGQWSAHKFVIPYPARPGRFSINEPHVRVLQSGYSIFVKNDKDQVEQFTPIGSFLCSLFQKLAWRDPQMRSMARHLQDAGLLGGGAGEPRAWNMNEVLSAEVAARVQTVQLTNGDPYGDWEMSSL